jgi:signal peptidase I
VIDEQTEQRRGSFWRELPILLGVAILVALLVRFFVLQTFYIPSPSMEHTLNLWDRVLVNKLVYNFRSPDRGEIIVFKAPTEWQPTRTEEDFIKRVIGVSGDRIVCCDAQKRLTLNGQPLDEPYLYRDADGTPDLPAQEPFDITVPQGRLWVMGDHRSASGDSLEHWRQTDNITFATVPESNVVGRAFVLFWPLNRMTWLSVPETYDRLPAAAGR